MGELPLWGMQIDPEAAKQEIKDVMADDGGKKLNEVCVHRLVLPVNVIDVACTQTRWACSFHALFGHVEYLSRHERNASCSCIMDHCMYASG